MTTMVRNYAKLERRPVFVMNCATLQLLCSRSGVNGSRGMGWTSDVELACRYANRATAQASIGRTRKILGPFDYELLTPEELQKFLAELGGMVAPGESPPLASAPAGPPEPTAAPSTVPAPTLVPSIDALFTLQELADARNSFYHALASYSAADEMRAVERSKLRTARIRLRLIESYYRQGDIP